MPQTSSIPANEFGRLVRQHNELCTGRLTVTGFLDFAKGGWAHTYECPVCGAYASKSAETRNSTPLLDIGGGVLASE